MVALRQDISLQGSMEVCRHTSLGSPLLRHLSGLTIGRVALLWVNKKVGEKRVLFIYTILCIGHVHRSQRSSDPTHKIALAWNSRSG